MAARSFDVGGTSRAEIIRHPFSVGTGFEVFLWFVTAFEASAALVVLFAPFLGSDARLGQATLADAALLSVGAAAALAALVDRLPRRRRQLLVAVAAIPLAVLFVVALQRGDATDAVALGFTLLGLLAVARSIACDRIARWHVLPTMAGALFAVLGLTLVASAAPSWSTSAAGWPQIALLLASGVALLLGERLGTPRARLAAATLAVFALEGAVTGFLAKGAWIPLAYVSMLALFLLLRAVASPSLRALALTLLAVVATNGILHVVGTMYAALSPSLAADGLRPGELLDDLALILLAAGWFLDLRPSALAGRAPAVAALVAIGAGLFALPLVLVFAPGGFLSDAWNGQYVTSLLILALGGALLVEPRIPRVASGPFLVALGCAALATSVDRALSIDPLAGDTHQALTFAAISLAIGLSGIIRAQDGPISGRIFAALAGPLALLIVLFAVSGTAIQQLALGETGGLAPAAVLASAELLLSFLFVASLVLTVVGGTLLTLTITRPLRSLLITLGRQAHGDVSARSGLTQSDEIGTVGRALDATMDETQAHFARLRSIVEGSLDAFVSLSEDGLVTDFSPRAEALTGWRRDEILGRSLSDTLLPPLARRALPAPAAWLAQAGGTRAATRGRFPLIHRDGHLIQCEASTTAVRLASGEVVGGAFFHDITAEEAREAELEHLALFDKLTDLPNRTLFEDRFGFACAAGGRDGYVGLATIVLDRFNAVNESLGHTTGDEVLRKVGRRLTETLRAGDTLARLGGDEFGIILSGATGRTEAEARIEQCLSAVRRPIAMEGHILHLTASAGLTVGSPSYGSFDDFLRGADLAATEAKRQGGDIIAIAPQSSAAASTEAMSLVADLHVGLERGEIFLVYQPIVDLVSRACERVEVLARWRHPILGLILPAEFIPAIERSHFIRSLGYWVLEHALDDLVSWRAAGRDIGVCVNVSARQFGDPGFVDAVLGTVLSRGLPTGALTLELTEATFIDRASPIVADLARLRSAGVRISIDDFGTGYSSVAQLGSLPVDEVKIDRTFVAAATTDPGRAAVVRATAALAGAFHIPFVAEGVEDEATWDFLRDLGQGSVQGYLVSRPIPPEAVVPWLESWERSFVGSLV